MTRVMIDATHNGLPSAMPTIRTLSAGEIVALYDTGSPGIAATASDIAEIPTRLTTVFIDQGFTGSPNMSATIRDCETGTWLLAKAVNKTGWKVPRPTLYLGFPDTVTEAYNLGWRGDVWLVASSPAPPLSPPPVQKGINVVAVQWNFSNPYFDASVVFDSTWPEAIMPDPTPTPPGIQSGWKWCHKCQGLFFGHGMAKSYCPAGDTHDDTGSSDYSLPYVINPPVAP